MEPVSGGHRGGLYAKSTRFEGGIAFEWRGCIHFHVDLELAQIGGVGEREGFHLERWGDVALVHAMRFATWIDSSIQ